MNNELETITEEKWYEILGEEHIDPDYWCDECPADYGIRVEGWEE